MNMISTGAFLTEMDASDNQKNSLVNKLVSAWEQKNSKTARAGGVSLMALSLAACGSSEDDAVSYTQVQYDAAKAAATTAAEEAAATAAATASTAAATAAATAATAAAADKATSVAAATAAADEAAATAAAALKVTTDATLATLQGQYDALVAPKSLALTTATDMLIGGAGADTFTGAAANYSDNDQITDATTGDGDTATLTITVAATPIINNVETVTITQQSTSARTLTASSMTGVDTLTVIKGDVSVGGTTVAGNKTIDINAMDAADVGTVVLGAGVTSVAIDQTLTSGATINADTASGNVTIIGAATVNAAGAGTGDTVQVEAFDNSDATAATVAAQNAKAVTVNTAAATVNILQSNGGDTLDFTGVNTITANGATTVLIENATGGLTLSATADNAQIRVDNIDASGASITVGTGVASAGNADIDLDLDGTTATTDAVTVAGAGTIDLDTTGTGAHEIETLNLSGTSAAVTYQMVSSAPNVMNVTGSQNVTVSNTTVNSAGLDFNDNSTGTTTYSISGAAGADRDISDIAADAILITGDIATAVGGDTLVVGAGATVQIGSDQTDLEIHADVASSTLNLATADDTAASGATIAITTAATNFATNVTTVNLDATIGTYTATDTTLATTGSTMNVTGNKAVDVGNFTGVTYNGNTSTGAQTINTAGNTTAITTGSGADTVTADIATKMDVITGGGIDTVIMDNNLLAESTLNAGGGGDNITLNDVSSMVILGDSGNDTIAVGTTDVDAIIDGGADTDTVTFGNATIDFTTGGSNDNFKLLNVEALTLVSGSALTFSATQFALDNTYTITGNSAATSTLTIAGTAAGETIDASGVTMTSSALTLNGAGGADTITGTAAGDTISGGAGEDVLAGGSGTDLLTYTGAADTADTGTQTGIAINLGLTAVTSSTVATAMGTNGYTQSGITSVASGSAEYLYAAAAASDSAVGDTLSGFENITGSNGGDYIKGTANANVFIGGTGADYLVGNGGADTFIITSGLTRDETSDFAINDDLIHIDLSALNATSGISSTETDTLITFSTAAAAPVDTLTSTTVAVATITDDTATAANINNANIILLNGGATTFANVGDAVDAMEEAGAFTVTFENDVANEDTFIFAYENSTSGNVHIAAASFEAADTNNGAADGAAAGGLKGIDLLNLGGVTDVTTLDAADFDFIA